MSGMITTGNTNISEYGGRTIAIEVTGMCHQDVMRNSNYTVKVPYSRMSQTIQNISRMGGKVANISLGDGASAPAPTQAQASESEPEKRSGGKRNRNRNK